MLKKRLSTNIAVVGLIASTLNGCAAVRNDLHHSGGYGGYMLDRHFMDASASKQLQLLRATMIIAIVSRMSLATVHDGREADAFIDYLTNATREVNTLAGHLYPSARLSSSPVTPGTGTGTGTGADTAASNQSATFTPCTPQMIGSASPAGPDDGEQCEDYTALFEADLPRLEYMVFRLVAAALPQREAASFARAAQHGDVLVAALRALRLAGSAVDAGHRGAAAYRSVTEILAAAVRNGQGSRCAGATIEGDTVETALRCLGVPDNSNRSGHSTGQSATYPAHVTSSVFRPLFALVQSSCLMMPVPAPEDWDKPGTAQANRLQRCAAIQFRPRMRFDGISAMRATSTPPAQQGSAVPNADASASTRQ